MLKSISILAAFVAVVNADPKDDAIKAELNRLQGTWQLVSAETAGKKVADDLVKKIRVIINGSKHTVYLGDDVVAKEIPFTIDPSKKPKTTTDRLPDGTEIHGIYELDGDTLTSCIAPAGKDRPKEFSASAESGNTMRVFKRVKP